MIRECQIQVPDNGEIRGLVCLASKCLVLVSSPSRFTIYDVRIGLELAPILQKELDLELPCNVAYSSFFVKCFHTLHKKLVVYFKLNNGIVYVIEDTELRFKLDPEELSGIVGTHHLYLAKGKNVHTIPITKSKMSIGALSEPIKEITTDEMNRLAKNERARPYYCMFQGMYYEFNGLHVAHGPFITSFDLSQRVIVKHTKFSHDIFRLFEKVALPALMNFGVIL